MATQRKSTSRSRAKLALITPEPEGGIRLAPEDAEEVRIQLAIILHHQQIGQQLQEQLVAHLEEKYGVSVRSGGGYSLNTAEGRLERTG